MDDIYSKEYASFMEETLQSLVTLPVEGICIIAKLSGGAAFAHYYNSGMMDKISYAGLIQQDAMLEMLRANGLVPGDNQERDNNAA